MKLTVTTNGRLYKTQTGEYYTPIVYGYNFFQRYLKVFQEIKLIAHVESSTEEKVSGMLRVDGPGLEVFEVPFPHGKIDYIKKYFEISARTKNALADCDACILRIPDQLGFQVFKFARKAELPVGVEVTSNSWEFFEKGSYDNPLRPLLRVLWDFQQRRACSLADATSYVTKYAIQRRYPPNNKSNSFTTNCSDVDIRCCMPVIKHFETKKLNSISILHVAGSISGKAKGHKELIEAAAILKNKGLIVDIHLVGSGDLDKDILDTIKDNGLNVTLHGSLSALQVYKVMREMDLFVFPSYREGLPRVVVEAMANGMPIVATDLDGILELLDKNVLVPVRDSDSLAGKIAFLMNHPQQMSIQSKKNIAYAQNYAYDVLEEKRTEFYKYIKAKALKRNEKTY